MLLRRRLFGLVGTLMLAVSPTAIVLAQDAQAPTTEAPAPGKPSVEDILKRHKQKQQAAPDDTQGQDAVPPKPRQGKPKPAAAQDGAGNAPAPADDGASPGPAMKPKRQKPVPAAEAPDAPATQVPDQPAVKPRAGGNQPPSDATPAQTDDQQNGVGKPQRQKPTRPADNGQQAQPGAAPDGTDQGQEQGQGQNRPRKPRPNGQDSNQPQDQTAPDNGVQQGQGGRNRLPGQGNPPGQGALPLPGQGTLPLPGQTPQQGGGIQQGQEGRPLQGPVNQAAEQRAIGLLGDNTPFDRMNDQQLRQRLDVYRSALAAGNLSDGTEQALIQRLNGARAALRNRVSQQEDGSQQSGQPGRNSQFGRPQFQQGSPRPQDIPAILADRRPSNVLTIDQLNRRILVYRDATNDQRYSPEDRDAFAQYLQNDRGELRRRLLSDRGQRDDRLRRPGNGMRLDMDIVPRGPRLQSVWAAEVDDDQIEQQFAARPLRPLPRRFPRADFFAQPEMVMEQPFVRQSIPSVELDTIHFGFNESFIREEEVANLDRIGRILERIVAAHPDEVFVIEGNTDAVGDDGYNLGLSKDRAEAVKQALTQYYVISPDNLVTAGLGERYLKIPTPEPEQENRRVTIRRITPLLQN